MNLGLTAPLNPLRPGNAAGGAARSLARRPPWKGGGRVAGLCCGGRAAGRGGRWRAAGTRSARALPPPAPPPPPSPSPAAAAALPLRPPLYFPPSPAGSARSYTVLREEAGPARGGARLGRPGWAWRCTACPGVGIPTRTPNPGIRKESWARGRRGWKNSSVSFEEVPLFLLEAPLPAGVGAGADAEGPPPPGSEYGGNEAGPATRPAGSSRVHRRLLLLFPPSRLRSSDLVCFNFLKTPTTSSSFFFKYILI